MLVENGQGEVPCAGGPVGRRGQDFDAGRVCAAQAEAAETADAGQWMSGVITTHYRATLEAATDPVDEARGHGEKELALGARGGAARWRVTHFDRGHIESWPDLDPMLEGLLHLQLQRLIEDVDGAIAESLGDAQTDWQAGQDSPGFVEASASEPQIQELALARSIGDVDPGEAYTHSPLRCSAVRPRTVTESSCQKVGFV